MGCPTYAKRCWVGVRWGSMSYLCKKMGKVMSNLSLNDMGDTVLA